VIEQDHFDVLPYDNKMPLCFSDAEDGKDVSNDIEYNNIESIPTMKDPLDRALSLGPETENIDYAYDSD